MGLAGCASTLRRQFSTPEPPPTPSGTDSSPPVTWITNHLGRFPWARPVVDGDTLYSAGHFLLSAIDTDDGSERWQFKVRMPSDHYCYTGRFTMGGDGLYTAGCSRVHAADLSGSVRWRVEKNDLEQSFPVVTDDFVIFNRRNVIALEKRNGTVAWRSDRPGETLSPPVIVGDKVVCGSNTGTAYVYDLSSGKQTASFNTGRDYVTALLSEDGVVYARSDYVHAVDVRTNRERWRVEVGPATNHLPPDLANGVLVTGSDDGTVTAVDVTDGSVRWNVDIAGDSMTPPRIGDDTVYVGSGNRVYAIDLETGARQWHLTWKHQRVDLEVPFGPPPGVIRGTESPLLVADNTLYVGTSGELYAFDVS